MITEKTETKQRRGTSIPLIVGFLIIGAVGYLYGEQIMTYVFYLQEGRNAKSGIRSAVMPEDFKAEDSSDSGAGPGAGVAPKGMSITPPEPSGLVAGGNSGGAGANMDPEELFAQRDKDSSGKLEGDEISERMQARLAEVDKDQDNALSKEEFLSAWGSRQSANTGNQRPPSDSTPAATEPAASEPPAAEPAASTEPKA